MMRLPPFFRLTYTQVHGSPHATVSLLIAPFLISTNDDIFD